LAISLSPDGRLIAAACIAILSSSSIRNRAGSSVASRPGADPTASCFSTALFFVSSWADAAVLQHNTVNGAEPDASARSHTTDMVPATQA
jgi:hypothetical protein